MLMSAAVGWPGRVSAQQTPIATGGRGVLADVSLADGESIAVELKLRNSTRRDLRVGRSEAFLACEGGWLNSIGSQVSAGGKFFGNEPTLAAGGEYNYRFNYKYSTPVTHYLLSLQTRGPSGPASDQVIQLPVARKGSRPPPALKIKAPVFLALQGPVEVLELASGETVMPVVGQVVNTSGSPLTLKRWRFRLKDAKGGTVFDRDLVQTYRLEKNAETVNEFLYVLPVGKGFQKGTLVIDAQVDLGGQALPVNHEAPVEAAKPRVVASPVDGLWEWNNGPGELAFHTHYHFPEQRYAYDLIAHRDAAGGRPTFSGDPGRNESYFAWDRPVRCVEDGKVVTVIDDVPDNSGNRPNPANKSQRNAMVVVEHAGRGFSGYIHVRQGSAVVKPGQSVKAGDVLAKLGNAGMSSEPHLHFSYRVLDETGRYVAVPVSITGLKTRAGVSVVGVPKGSEEYLTGKPG